MHPFRPPPSRPASTRSKESPMDFTYESPPNSTFTPQKSQIKPLNIINPNATTVSSWFGRKPASTTEEPQRKRAHYEVENMDWEACPSEARNSPKPNLFPSIVTKPSEPSGGKFLFKPPDGLVVPPTSGPTVSPPKLQPESFGLRHRVQSTFDTDADTSVESVPSKLYSHNGVKHEERRRRQRNLRSKLNQMSVDSDGESIDQTSEDEPEDLRPSRSLVRSRARSPAKAPRTTTHNHLTIHGWGPRSEPTTPSPTSKLATETPYILLVYLQLLFNASLVALALYLIFNFVLIMRTDVDSRLEVQTKQLRQEIEICENEYRTNRCFPIAERTKFIEQHCIEWERCMTQNPSQLSKSKIGAETFAEVMNGFVDVISLKTMVQHCFLSICDPCFSSVSYKNKCFTWTTGSYSTSSDARIGFYPCYRRGRHMGYQSGHELLQS